MVDWEKELGDVIKPDDSDEAYLAFLDKVRQEAHRPTQPDPLSMRILTQLGEELALEFLPCFPAMTRFVGFNILLLIGAAIKLGMVYEQIRKEREA